MSSICGRPLCEAANGRLDFGCWGGGVLLDAEGDASYLSIFKLYWLYSGIKKAT